MKNPYKLGDLVKTLKENNRNPLDKRPIVPIGSVCIVCHNEDPDWIMVEGYDVNGDYNVFDYGVDDVKLATKNDIKEWEKKFKFKLGDKVKILKTKTELFNKKKKTVLKGTIGEVIYTWLKMVTVYVKDKNGKEIIMEYDLDEVELVKSSNLQIGSYTKTLFIEKAVGWNKRKN